MLEDVRILRKELEEYQSLRALLPDCGSWRSDALEQKLRRTADRLAERLWEITKWIAEIPDGELRLIFELRYFRGYTWHQVASELPTYLSADGARMKHDRYLKKMQNAKGKKQNAECKTPTANVVGCTNELCTSPNSFGPDLNNKE